MVSLLTEERRCATCNRKRDLITICTLSEQTRRAKMERPQQRRLGSKRSRWQPGRQKVRCSALLFYASLCSVHTVISLIHLTFGRRQQRERETVKRSGG